ncbi:MAG: protein kinase [Deltaproteobacteria bacterium]|nr:protein kinase [Deltaproteobacteria bacterium]
MALPRHSLESGSPAVFGKYELFELLGRGGMAEVFLARAKGPLGFERILVIKRILAHLSEDDDFREMFVAEAKLSAALAHGNVVQVYEFGEVDGQLFLAMEYVPGSDLRTVLKKVALEGVGISPGVAAHIAIEVLAGLGHAHSKADLAGKPLHIVHRDVSPSNVLLSTQGEVKICDFGIAKMAARHTSTGRLKGKFAYMSPEQAGGEPVDGRSDLFGVGIVLWESLTGKRLFKGDSDVSTLGMVRSAEIPDLPDLGAPCQDRLRRILRRALEKKPSRRYPSAEVFAADLREWLGMARVREPAAALRDMVRQLQAGEDASRARSVVVETTSERSGVVDAAQTAVTPRPEMDSAPAPAPAPFVAAPVPASFAPPPVAAPSGPQPAPGGHAPPAPGPILADSNEISAASAELIGRRRPGLLFLIGGAALAALAALAFLLWPSEPTTAERPASRPTAELEHAAAPVPAPAPATITPPASAAGQPAGSTMSSPAFGARDGAVLERPVSSTVPAQGPGLPAARTEARLPGDGPPLAPRGPTRPEAASAGAKAPARPRPRPSTVNGTVDPFSNLSGGAP